MTNVKAVLELASLLNSGKSNSFIIEELYANPVVYGFAPHPTEPEFDFGTHEGLVKWILQDDETLHLLSVTRKILAIKRVRSAGGLNKDGYSLVSLLSAKNAVEDHRVTSQVAIIQLRRKLNQ